MNIYQNKTMKSMFGGLKKYRIIIALLILSFPHLLQAKVNKDLIYSSIGLNDSIKEVNTKYTRDNKILRFTVAVQHLTSTHGTSFKGADFVVSYLLSPPLSVGLGIEYSYTSFHFDNNYNLTHVKFYPVFLDSKLNLTRNTLLTPFIHLSTGISFVNYTKENIDFRGIFYHVSETGLYLYSGIGVSYKVCNYFSTFIDMGFKGYHMSFHDLDVNPHGLTVRLGLEF